jgi:hypothetical protein
VVDIECEILVEIEKEIVMDREQMCDGIECLREIKKYFKSPEISGKIKASETWNLYLPLISIVIWASIFFNRYIWIGGKINPKGILLYALIAMVAVLHSHTAKRNFRKEIILKLFPEARGDKQVLCAIEKSLFNGREITDPEILERISVVCKLSNL